MRKQTFNLDMDGVVADWVAGAAKIVGYRIDNPTQHYPDEDWKKIRSHERMFRDLPMMPHALEMIDIARGFRDQLGYELVYLTAIPHYNDIHWAFWDKMLWATNRTPDIPVHFGPYSADKAIHCQSGDILVDDRIDNCTEWEQAGGTAVCARPGHYRDALNTLAAMFEKKLALQRLSNM